MISIISIKIYALKKNTQFSMHSLYQSLVMGQVVIFWLVWVVFYFFPGNGNLMYFQPFLIFSSQIQQVKNLPKWASVPDFHLAFWCLSYQCILTKSTQVGNFYPDGFSGTRVLTHPSRRFHFQFVLYFLVYQQQTTLHSSITKKRLLRKEKAISTLARQLLLR